MTSVLTAFRSNEEKVAAAIAECRRMGIEVLPPDVHRSGVEFTVEGEAIRFGLLAVKNVGQGAIESIIAAREEGGAFRRSPTSARGSTCAWSNRGSSRRWPGSARCTRSAIRPRSSLGLDDAMAAGQAAQRDRSPARRRCSTWRRRRRGLERPLPEHDRGAGPRAAALGEGAARASTSPSTRWARSPSRSAEYVTAYSGDLKDESLDGQRVVIGGIVTGFRRVITKAKRDDGRRDDRGPPGLDRGRRLPQDVRADRGDLDRRVDPAVAGRVDHRGEEVSLLADLATEWDAAVARGPRGVRPRGRGGRSRSRAAPPAGGGRAGNGRAGQRQRVGRREREAAMPGAAAPPAPREIPYVSPLRAEFRREAPAPSAPDSAAIATVARPSPAPAPDRAARSPPPSRSRPTRSRPACERLTPDDDLEPALPDEARDRAAVAARAPTPPLDPSPTAILHVTFATGAGSDRVVGAMEAFKGLLVERPGSTRVVLHVPAPSGGASLPMELRRGVAYDAELLAEVRRRLGEGIVELSLS